MKTRQTICSELNIETKTFDRIIEYLKLNPKVQYHEKAHKLCNFYDENDENQIKSFLKDNPNKRALFMNLSKIKKFGSLENFYKQKNEKSRKTKMERYGNPNYVNKEQIRKSHLEFWADEKKKEDCIKRRRKTKLEKYGDENYNNTEKNKQTKIEHYGSVENAHKMGAIKSKETKLEKYGDENYVNVEKAQQTKLERYGDKSYHNIEQMKKTNLERYGVEFSMQNKEISAKMKETWRNKTEKEILDFVLKYQNTKMKRYGDKNYVNAEQCSITWNSKSKEEFHDIENKRKNTNVKKYGVEYVTQVEKVKEKIKNTNLEKYGCECVLQNEKIKERIKNTNLEKYGVEYTLSLDETKEKIRNTVLKKYGVKHIFQTEEFKEKSKKTSLEHFGVEHPSQSEQIKEKIKQKRNKKLEFAKSQNLLSVSDLANKFNHEKSTITFVLKKLKINIKKFDLDDRYYISSSDLPILEDYFAKTEMNGKSFLETQVVDYVKSIYNEEIMENTKRIISPKELDIYIPQKKVAIEFDGLYWHNELFVNKNYHLNKTIACEEKGIDLIHVFEDDWLNRKEIVKSMIASRLGIYKQKIFARKCKCKILDYSLYKDLLQNFFDENHLQGFTHCDVFVGLIYNDELVQCMGFNEKGWHDGNTELTRMTTKINTQVIGGFSKLMKFVTEVYGYKNITSYINRAWFNGKGYFNSGFEVVKINPPNYYYVVDFTRVHKSHFRKDKIKRLYENNLFAYYDENESEHELMLKNEIFRIYDCGTIKVVYKPQLS